MNKDGIEYLYLTTYKTGQKQVLEIMRAYTPGLYGTLISSVETHSITNPKLVDQSTFTLWHDRLGHPVYVPIPSPRKRKERIVSINHDANVTTSNVSEDKIPEVILFEDPKRNEQDLNDSYEMSINYAHNSLGWYRKEIKMNDIFAYSVALEIMDEDDNDPQTMEECQHRNDWKSWKKAIQDELDSLNKREVFGPIIPTPKGVKQLAISGCLYEREMNKMKL
ncbi:hypothetical protein Sango_1166200 [Sesamum angolense]|uniref:Uncharacterized protein n=1 Tax=Sesamum angolense TaxID=2727404 RepID=A0AAE1WWB8_9LAMI|nr:hypothetical protein Sango_1166200 [Sesamum angolense]